MKDDFVLNPKQLADELYYDIVDNIVETLEQQGGYNYPNAFIELGAQVAEGLSYYANRYFDLIDDLAISKLNGLPSVLRTVMRGRVSIEVELLLCFDATEDEAIIKEISQRVCNQAEAAFEEFEYDHEGLVECSCENGYLPRLQQFDVFDTTYYGDDSNEANEWYSEQINNQENFMGTHYRYKCDFCEKTIPLYDDIEAAKKAWNKLNSVQKK